MTSRLLTVCLMILLGLYLPVAGHSSWLCGQGENPPDSCCEPAASPSCCGDQPTGPDDAAAHPGCPLPCSCCFILPGMPDADHGSNSVPKVPHPAAAKSITEVRGPTILWAVPPPVDARGAANLRPLRALIAVWRL